MILDFYNEAGQLAISYKIYRALGVGVPGPARPGRQRQRRGDPAHQAGERGLGARRVRDRADRAQLHLDPRLGSCAARSAGELLLAAPGSRERRGELRRPLTLLALALPDRERQAARGLSLAERNRLLLRLHELSFGPMLSVFATCPHCAAPLEFSVPVAGADRRATERAARGPACMDARTGAVPAAPGDHRRSARR